MDVSNNQYNSATGHTGQGAPGTADLEPGEATHEVNERSEVTQ